MILTFYFLASNGVAQDGAEIYKRSCAACHSIGGGKLVGPDLAGITQKKDQAWLKSFIRNSAEVIKSGDPDAVAIAKEFNNLLMPPFTGSDGDIAAILRYIESKGGTAKSAAADTFLNAANEKNVNRGKALFTGIARLKNGGVSCIGCHSVQDAGNVGGSMAKSLNLSYFMMKGAGIKSLLQSPAFPAMTASYQNHPLTDQEIYDLAAYLKSASFAKIKGEKPIAGFPFFLIGVAGWFFIIIFFYGLWRLRKRFSVNHEIFARQLKSQK